MTALLVISYIHAIWLLIFDVATPLSVEVERIRTFLKCAVDPSSKNWLANAVHNADIILFGCKYRYGSYCVRSRVGSINMLVGCSK